MSPGSTPPPASRQPAPPFAMDRDRRADLLVLTLHGELDLSTAGLLTDAADDLGGATRLVLDLAELSFIDSAGLRALMNLDLRARSEGWDLALAVPAPVVLRLLKLTGFDKRLDILDRLP